MKFEEKLMTLRKVKGWSQEDLSNKIGVSRQTISKWESSQTTPEMNKLIELSKLFEISVDELINDVPKEENTDEKEEKIYPKVNLKPTNILLIISCILIVVGVIFTIILFLKDKDDLTYVNDVVMITYNYTKNDNVEVVEIYSFNKDSECIGINMQVKTCNQSDYEYILNDVNKSINQKNMNYNIVLNNNEITWSEKIYNKKYKDKLLKERKESLIEVDNLVITDM